MVPAGRYFDPMASREDSDALREEVESLRLQIEVLTNAIDELRDALQYAVENGLPVLSSLGEHARRITSMPVDPAAPDFAKRVNRLTRADVLDGGSDATNSNIAVGEDSGSGGRQRDLFE